MTARPSILAVLLFGVAFSSTVAGQESAGVEDRTWCTKPIPEGEFLDELRAATAEVHTALCQEALTPIAARDLVQDYLLAHAGWFDSYGGLELVDGPTASDARTRLAELTHQKRRSVAIRLAPWSNEIEVDGEALVPADPSRCPVLSGEAAPDCRPVLEEFVELYNHIHNTWMEPRRRETVAAYQRLIDEWGVFLNTMKSQTTLELAVNSMIYGRSHDSFTGPPEHQVVLLHPAVLVEHVSDAAAGERMEEAIAFELLGINWWQNNRWYQPSGISALAAYSERATVDDWGYGVVVHFGNNYSLGWTHRDEGNGILLSVDLWKIFSDPQAALSSFRGSVEAD